MAKPAPGRELTPQEITKFKIQFQQEQGSTFQLDDLFFTSWSGGEVFDLGVYEAADMQEMLRKDATARALSNALTGPIRSATWTLKPGPGDKGEADFINEFLNRPAAQGGMKVPMRTLIAQALSSRIYRRAFFEKIFKKDEKTGKIVYDKIAYRPASTCSIRRDPMTGRYLGFKQRPVRKGIQQISDFAGIDIDAMYAWVHINGAWIDPIKGFSDMEVPYWCHTQKMKIIFLWFMFLETQATPRTVVSSANDTVVDSNAAKVAQLKAGGVVGVPGTVTLSHLESNGQGAALFMEAIQWLDKCMTESVLAGFLNLTGSASGSSGRGSYALSKDASSFFLENEQSVAFELANSITEQLIAPLVILNFGPDATVPQFEFGTIGEGDIDRLITLINGLAASQNQPFPAALIFAFAEKAANYLDIDVSEFQADMDKAKDMADQASNIALENKKVALDQAKNPPTMPGMPGSPTPRPNPLKSGSPASVAVAKGAGGLNASLNTIQAAVKQHQANTAAIQKAAAGGGKQQSTPPKGKKP